MDPIAAERSVDSPRASAARGQPSGPGDAFQGIMQMMASIATNRAEKDDRPVDTAVDTADHDDKAERTAERDARPERRAEATPRATGSQDHPPEAASEHGPGEHAIAKPDMNRQAATDTDGDAAAVQPADPQSASQSTSTPDQNVEQDVVEASDQNVEQDVVEASDQQAGATAASDAAPANPANPAQDSPTMEQTAAVDRKAVDPQMRRPTGGDAVLPGDGDVARPIRNAAKQPAPTRPDTPVQSNHMTKPTAKPTPEAQTSGPRSDMPQGAKVTVEPAGQTVRTQGVSYAVLLQAQQQQAAAGNANTATPLHVGGNQPTFVGADQAGAAQGGSGNNTGANGSGQQGNQLAGQSAGAGFGATIGQRGFAGDAARAQFQEILATRTGRTLPAGSGGQAGTPNGTLHTNSATTMAGPGGPQSTLTASSVARAEPSAHGRPGANTGTVADQVAVKLSSAARNGTGRVTIHLNPEDLGKLDVKLEIGRDGLVRAAITVEKPETLDLLQRDARALERALQEAGLKTNGDSLEFDLRGEDGRWADGPDPERNANRQTSSEDDGAAGDDGDAAGHGGIQADGSLDLVA